MISSDESDTASSKIPSDSDSVAAPSISPITSILAMVN